MSTTMKTEIPQHPTSKKLMQEDRDILTNLLDKQDNRKDIIAVLKYYNRYNNTVLKYYNRYNNIVKWLRSRDDATVEKGYQMLAILLTT